ncbi:hypothetical protein ABIF69_006895 [Bradyrhizobium japonicum]
MMGNVSRPNDARPTCPGALIGRRILWIDSLLVEPSKEEHLHRRTSRSGFCCPDAHTIESPFDIAAFHSAGPRSHPLAEPTWERLASEIYATWKCNCGTAATSFLV